MPENRSLLAPDLLCPQKNCFPVQHFEIFLDGCSLTWNDLFSSCDAVLMCLTIRQK